MPYSMYARSTLVKYKSCGQTGYLKNIFSFIIEISTILVIATQNGMLSSIIVDSKPLPAIKTEL